MQGNETDTSSTQEQADTSMIPSIIAEMEEQLWQMQLKAALLTRALIKKNLYDNRLLMMQGLQQELYKTWASCAREEFRINA